MATAPGRGDEIAAILSWLRTPANRTGLGADDILTWATAITNNSDELLEHAETDCLNLLEKWRAGSLKSGPAIAKLIEVIRRRYGPVAAFSAAKARVDERGASSESDQRTLDSWLPRVRDALNNAKRVAMTIKPSPTLQLPLGFDYVHTVANQLPDDVEAQVAKLHSVLATLGTVGGGVGWEAPANASQVTPEDHDTYEDDEGCPDADDDADGLPDRVRKRASATGHS